jgi:hypothetical protein
VLCPAGLLEGSGKRVRHVKLRPGSEVDEQALAALIEVAYEDVKARVGERNERHETSAN